MTLPPEERRAGGLAAEEQACRHLEREGFAVLERNFRSPAGEIDIVARRGELLVFVEVRSRETASFGSPEETVGREKRLRVVSAARRYLSRTSPDTWREARFDVIAVEGSGAAAVLRHYPAAFDAKGKIL
ncbi:MAG: YraN family protein [Thermodesulfobacteriota bacterium]